MASFVVSGTSRGIGLELTRQLLGLPATDVSNVFAITRAEPSLQLKELMQSHEGRLINIIIKDLSDEKLVKEGVSRIEAALRPGTGIDYLINNAGIMPVGSKMSAATKGSLLDNYNVNVVTAQVLTSNLLPLLEKGSKKTCINISTAMGSIAYANRYTFALTPEYKLSKAAMNMLTAQYALELADAGFTFLAVSPGWVKTDLGGDAGDLNVAESGKAILDIVFKANVDQNGTFWNVKVDGWENVSGPNQYDGKQIPW